MYVDLNRLVNTLHWIRLETDFIPLGARLQGRFRQDSRALNANSKFRFVRYMSQQPRELYGTNIVVHKMEGETRTLRGQDPTSGYSLGDPLHEDVFHTAAMRFQSSVCFRRVKLFEEEVICDRHSGEEDEPLG